MIRCSCNNNEVADRIKKSPGVETKPTIFEQTPVSPKKMERRRHDFIKTIEKYEVPLETTLKKTYTFEYKNC